MRFTYTTEIISGQSVTFIEETNGVFHGHAAEQVSVIAENLYPNYQSNNMSNIFSDIYFNYCVRRLLNGQSIPNTYTPKNLKFLDHNQFNELGE